jgi:hypothetical protein
MIDALAPIVILLVVAVPVVLYAVWYFGGWSRYLALWRGLVSDAWDFWTGRQ